MVLMPASYELFQAGMVRVECVFHERSKGASLAARTPSLEFNRTRPRSGNEVSELPLRKTQVKDELERKLGMTQKPLAPKWGQNCSTNASFFAIWMSDAAWRRQSSLWRWNSHTVARMTMMGELTASIAHEVLQPLAAMSTNAEAGLRWLARRPSNLLTARACLERIALDNRSTAHMAWPAWAEARTADARPREWLRPPRR